MAKAFVILLVLSPFLFTKYSFHTDAIRQSSYLVYLGIAIASLALNRQSQTKLKNMLSLDYLVLSWFLIRLFSSQLFTVYQSYTFEPLIFEFSLLLGYFYLRSLDLSLDLSKFFAKWFLLCLSFISILSLIFPDFFKVTLNNRLNAQFFHANLLGIYAVLCLSILLIKKQLKNCLYQIILVLFLVILCQSRTAFLMFLACLALNLKNKKLFILGISLLGVCLFLGYHFLAYEPIESYRLNLSTSLNIRFEILKSSFLAFLALPFGLGSGLFAERINPFLSSDFHLYFPNPSQHSLTNAHCFLLQFICESGFLALIFSIITSFKLKKYQSNPLFKPLLLFLATALVDVHLEQFSSRLILIFILANLANLENGALKIFKFKGLFPISLSLGICLAIIAPLYLHREINLKLLHNSLINNQGLALENNLKLIKSNPWPLSGATQYLILGAELERFRFQKAYTLGANLNYLFPGYYLSETITAQSLLLLDRYQEALTLIELAIDYHPLEEMNYLLKSQIHKFLKETKEAKKAYLTYEELKTRNFNFRDASL